MGFNSFPKRMRLSGRSAAGKLFAEGQSGFVYPFRYLFISSTADECGAGVSVLITVPKKYHKRANRRNVLKRRTREAFRVLNKELIEAAEEKKSVEIALIYSSKEMLEFKTIGDAVGKILRQIGQRM